MEMPTQYALSLVSGLQGNAVYHKNQFGEVTIIINLSKSGTSEDLGNGLIGTLPVGFRPQFWTVVPCISGSGENGTAKAAANLQIHTDGRVEHYTNQGSLVRSISANGVYLSAR